MQVFYDKQGNVTQVMKRGSVNDVVVHTRMTETSMPPILNTMHAVDNTEKVYVLKDTGTPVFPLRQTTILPEVSQEFLTEDYGMITSASPLIQSYRQYPLVDLNATRDTLPYDRINRGSNIIPLDDGVNRTQM